MGTLVTVRDLVHLTPGTVVSTLKSGCIEHFGVLTERHLFGEFATIISASKVWQAVVEDWPSDFSLNSPIYAHGVWSDQPWRLTIARARAQLRKPYRLFDNNCEHFVR